LLMSYVKVGFVLLSNSQRPIPSTRIAALNMFPFLRAAGFDPQIVFEPESATETPQLPDMARSLASDGFQIIVFQKVHGPDVERQARELSQIGIKTVYSVCDLVNDTMAALTDATIVITDYLKSLYSPMWQSKIHVVHDGIERPEIRKTAFRADGGSRKRPLSAVLVTSLDLDCLPVIETPPDWLEVTIVGRYAPAGRTRQRLRELRWQLASQPTADAKVAYLRFLANRRIRRQAWDPIGVYVEMCQADIGIIPITTDTDRCVTSTPPTWMVKSENRLTMKMSVGLPVIATPIPAYEPIVDQGRNGFLARSKADWNECLEALRDPGRRRAIGELARETVLQRFSMEEQACRLVNVLRSVIRDRAEMHERP